MYSADTPLPIRRLRKTPVLSTGDDESHASEASCRWQLALDGACVYQGATSAMNPYETLHWDQSRCWGHFHMAIAANRHGGGPKRLFLILVSPLSS